MALTAVLHLVNQQKLKNFNLGCPQKPAIALVVIHAAKAL